MWTFYSRPKLSLSSLKLSGDPVVQIAIRTGNQTYADTDIPMTMKICDGYGNCCFTNGPLHRQLYGGDRWRRVLGAVDIYEDKDSLGQCNKVRFSFQVVITFRVWLVDWLIQMNSCSREFWLVGPQLKLWNWSQGVEYKSATMEKSLFHHLIRRGFLRPLGLSSGS